MPGVNWGDIDDQILLISLRKLAQSDNFGTNTSTKIVTGSTISATLHGGEKRKL